MPFGCTLVQTWNASYIPERYDSFSGRMQKEVIAHSFAFLVPSLHSKIAVFNQLCLRFLDNLGHPQAGRFYHVCMLGGLETGAVNSQQSLSLLFRTTSERVGEIWPHVVAALFLKVCSLPKASDDVGERGLELLQMRRGTGCSLQVPEWRHADGLRAISSFPELAKYFLMHLASISTHYAMHGTSG